MQFVEEAIGGRDKEEFRFVKLKQQTETGTRTIENSLLW
jgi:hypothetical protein